MILVDFFWKYSTILADFFLPESGSETLLRCMPVVKYSTNFNFILFDKIEHKLPLPSDLFPESFP